ncbi:diguanylate cyclase domain-containing protein [Halothiobacillus diazotrophicus]|nr:diguanylate cyclase [Halothiobacillus diazotrophicus]
MTDTPRKLLHSILLAGANRMSPVCWLIVVVMWGILGGGAAAHAQERMAEQTVYVGVLSDFDRSAIHQQWLPTMRYLSTHVPGHRFVLLPVGVSDLQRALEARTLDFLLVHPAYTNRLKAAYGLSNVSTLINQGQSVPLNKFGGVVFTQRQRQDIQHLEDLRGKTIAFSVRDSFDGFQIQQGLLSRHGVDVVRDSRLMALGNPQDRSVLAVLEGHADAGFVRTGVLESMVRAGRLDLSRIRVLNEMIRPEFPFRLSTQLYPEWILTAASHVSMKLINQVAAALLVMQPDDPAARQNNYAGWSPPLSPAGFEGMSGITSARVVSPAVRHPAAAAVQGEWQAWHRYIDHHSFEAIMGLFALFLLTLLLMYGHARRVNRALHASQAQLQVMAHHDVLTGLPNRVLLEERLTLALAQARRSGREVAVCLLDLDGFKPINDTFGHLIGDRVLQEVSRRIQRGLRESDMVARYGGDEFVLVMDDFEDQRQLREVLERILRVLARPLACHPAARVRASIGVSIYPEDARDAVALLKNADEAMYVAKRAGGNRFVIHHPAPEVVPAPGPMLVRKA